MVKKSKRQQDDEDLKLTKEENQIARYLRLKCPKKQGNLNGMKVDFFIANKLVDCLMLSKWGPGTLNPPKDAPYNEKAKVPLLDGRHACFKFMQQLMAKELFSRAIKIYKEQPESSDQTSSNLRKRKAKELKENEKSDQTPNKSPQVEKKEKKKFKLEVHEDQRFIDDSEPYIWIFDPTSTMSSIIGALLILGSIAICCFPLWPSFVREGVYYLSLAGCGFLGSIIGLAVLKYIVFACLYIGTLGAIELWMFPNLTEDVGFFESFIPVYTLKWNSKKPKETIKESENVESEETIESESKAEETIENTTETVETNEPETTQKSIHGMRDLTTSTVEIMSQSKIGDSIENMEKIQEDFELVENDEDFVNKEDEN